MNGTKLLGTGLLILWLISALVLIGCKRASPAGGASTSPGSRSQDSGGKIQLSDPRAEVVLEVVQDRPAFFAHCKVKYRFIEGAPKSGTWYNILADLDGQGVGILKIGEGSALKAEGELEDKLLLPRASPGMDLAELKQAKIDAIKPERSKLPKQVVFQATQAPGKDGPFQPVGDKVNCAVKVLASYPAP